MATDEYWMDRALALAARGRYTARPNPAVGCVLVQGDEVVGEGWHERAGGPHAEVHALSAAGDRARGATAYVTLEPCAHYGRTPPCVEALIAAGVARVVAAIGDPDPRVAGRGFARLQAAGIPSTVGVRAEAARGLMRGFLSRHERGRPWLRVKLAASLDGRTALADGRSQWITGAAARADNMHWRARSAALLTGSGTVLADDPKLTVRGLDDAFLPPLRVVLDPSGRIPKRARVFDASAPTLWITGPGAARGDLPANVEQIRLPLADAGLDLDAVLHALHERSVDEVQVEAGARLAGAWIRSARVDELLLYLNPSLLGPDARPLLALPPLARLEDRRRFMLREVDTVGSDLRLLLTPIVEDAV